MSYDYQELAGRDGLIRNTNTIFIIEDDEANGTLLSELLLRETLYYPLLLQDSLHVLQLTQLIKPLLFLVDYYLPGMNGLELCDQLHAREELKDIPVIILSASLDEHIDEIQRRGLIALHKPFDLDELLLTIENVVVHYPGHRWPIVKTRRAHE
jgi:DNA-binding response OmpR family regulator